MKTRSDYIDCVKAIGICLVIIGHTFGGGLFALKAYHMPLFFFVAGLLINEQESIGCFVRKRISRLYIPFLIYEILFLLMHNFLYHLGIVSNFYFFPYDFITQIVHIVCFDNCEILLAPIWFLTVLFISGVAGKFIIWLVSSDSVGLSERWCIIIIALIGIALIYGGMLNGREGIWNINASFNCPQVFNISLVALGYTLFGYLFKNDAIRARIKYFKYGQLLVVFLFIGLMIFERKTKLVSDMRANKYTYIFAAPIFAALGIAMVFIIAKYIIKILQNHYLDKAKRSILCIGQNTFAIMCLHPLAFKLVGLVQVNYFGYDSRLLPDWGVVGYDIQWLILDCIVGIMVPLAGSCFVKKAALMYLGKRDIK